MAEFDPIDSHALARRASRSTVFGQFAQRARVHPQRVAVEQDARQLSYTELEDRVQRLALLLSTRGVCRGTVLAVLSENRIEVLELFLAAARLGAAVACPNTRLAAAELALALDLVEPHCVLVSARHQALLAAALPDNSSAQVLAFGPGYEAALQAAAGRAPEVDIDPEDALLILYTSGTTGSPKGAVICHRAELARNLVIRAEFGIGVDDTFVAWSPLYHMGAAECALGTLMAGGTVIVVDGFDLPRLVELVATRTLGWLLLMPGMVAAFAQELRARAVQPAGVKLCGVMADLVPPADIANVTRLLGAPYANTFGSTETGCPPCSSSLLPVGVEPLHLRKQQSPFCEVRLVAADGTEVPDGEPGELCLRGPTLFSGYYRADDANAECFRDGWYHMGDVFVRHPDGTLDFVDRLKYLIKTGGENVYPAEIERVLLADPDVADAAVVRQRDAGWGEVPVAFVARRRDDLSAESLIARCRAQLAGFKQPRAIVFIAAHEFPRNVTGKVLRHELEQRLPAVSHV